MGKFPNSSLKAHNTWHSSRGEIYLHPSCSAIYYVPFVIHGEIFFLLLWLRHSRRKILSLFLYINPIQSVLWNYVKECGGAIMAQIDLGLLKP